MGRSDSDRRVLFLKTAALPLTQSSGPLRQNVSAGAPFSYWPLTPAELRDVVSGTP